MTKFNKIAGHYVGVDANGYSISISKMNKSNLYYSNDEQWRVDNMSTGKVDTYKTLRAAKVA